MRTYDRKTSDILRTWPDPNGPGRVRRLAAVEEVLQRLPEDAYQVLDRLAEAGYLLWLVFPAGRLGNVRSVTIGEAGPSELVVIYLDAMLESPLIDPEIARGVAAHELAHVVLCHDRFTPSAGRGAIEQLAWQLVIDWGLAREAAKVLACHGAPLAGAREELLAGVTDGIQQA